MSEIQHTDLGSETTIKRQLEAGQRRQQQAEQQRLKQQQYKQQRQQQYEQQRLKQQQYAQQRQQYAEHQRLQQTEQQRLQQRKQQQQKPLLLQLLQPKPTTPPAPIVPKTEFDEKLIEPEVPKYYNNYGAEVILPDGKTIEYKTWTKYDLANWVQKFLTSETGQKCGAIIIKEEYDGSLMENLLDDTTKEGLGLTDGAFMKLKNHVAAVLNTHNKTMYLQKKRAFDVKKSLIPN